MDILKICQREANDQIKTVSERIKSQKLTVNSNNDQHYFLTKIREELFRLLSESGEFEHVALSDIELSLPPKHVISDLSCPVFILAKKSGLDPAQTAMRIVALMADRPISIIERVEAAGAYINIFLNKNTAYSEIIELVNQLGDGYGSISNNHGKIAVIDYSAPNIAKPIGVGHLRSTIIGQALANLYEATGYSVVRDNHIGDWGTQFGKLLVAYQLWGDEEKIAKNPIRELKDLYVKLNLASEQNPNLKEESRLKFSQLEQGDEKLLSIWKRFRDLSIEDFKKIYARLGIEFDTYIGESYFIESAKAVVGECLAQGYCRKDTETGAMVVDEQTGLPSFLIQKSDGSSLYITRDLATLKFRVAEFNPETILYVVGSEQSLQFKQLFVAAQKLGYLPENITAEHIDFGMVLSAGERMSTRKGTLIELDELLSEAVDKARAIIKEKNSKLTAEETNQAAEIVGVGSILYNDLRQSRNRNIDFDWKRMLDFEGGSAAYLQYVYVRIQSILRKANDGQQVDQVMEDDKLTLESDKEFSLAVKIAFFPEIIVRAQQQRMPHLLATYLEELAQEFNSFYQAVPILKAESSELRLSRIQLAGSTAEVLKNGLKLLNIRVPEKM